MVTKCPLCTCWQTSAACRLQYLPETLAAMPAGVMYCPAKSCPAGSQTAVIDMCPMSGAKFAAERRLSCMQTIMKAAEGVPIEERVLINQLATSMVALSQASHGHCLI